MYVQSDAGWSVRSCPEARSRGGPRGRFLGGPSMWWEPQAWVAIYCVVSTVAVATASTSATNPCARLKWAAAVAPLV